MKRLKNMGEYTILCLVIRGLLSGSLMKVQLYYDSR